MAHKFKSYARHVQKHSETEASYMACLRFVEDNLGIAKVIVADNPHLKLRDILVRLWDNQSNKGSPAAEQGEPQEIDATDDNASATTDGR